MLAKVTWGKTTFKLLIEPYKEILEQLHANNCLKSMNIIKMNLNVDIVDRLMGNIVD